jgi:hypothetical protein
MDVKRNTRNGRIARARDLQNASRQFGMMMCMRHCFGTYRAGREGRATLAESTIWTRFTNFRQAV